MQTYSKLILYQVKLIELFVVWCFLFVFGSVCIFYSVFSVWIKTVFYLLYWSYLVYLAYLHQLIGRSPRYVVKLSLQTNDTWLLKDFSGRETRCWLCCDSCLSSAWVMLCFKSFIEHKKIIVILKKTRQSNVAWRILQVYLRCVNKKQLY